jgi:ribonuclease HII
VARGKGAARKPAKTRCEGRWEREARAAGYSCIAGVDEAGRGSLFGPVFAAAVVLSPERPIRGLRDSKVLEAERREVLAHRIRERAVSWAVAASDPFEIDRYNILQASLLAMKRAISRLSPPCDYLLLDAVRLPDLDLPQQPMIHGDGRSQCIAAASILAKTERDACLRRWDAVFPEYGLAHHKGYATEEHQAALEKYGPTMLHRFSFEPVRLATQFPLWTGYDQREELPTGTAETGDERESTAGAAAGA